jgi:hypothetical protein
MAHILVNTETQQVAKLMESLRAKRMSVSLLKGQGDSFTPSGAQLMVEVPEYRLAEAFETLATSGQEG